MPKKIIVSNFSFNLCHSIKNIEEITVQTCYHSLTCSNLFKAEAKHLVRLNTFQHTVKKKLHLQTISKLEEAGQTLD